MHQSMHIRSWYQPYGQIFSGGVKSKLSLGEMAEWFMAPVLKTGIVTKNYRGFESLSLLLFVEQFHLSVWPIPKKRIARLNRAELQGQVGMSILNDTPIPDVMKLN